METSAGVFCDTCGKVIVKPFSTTEPGKVVYRDGGRHLCEKCYLAKQEASAVADAKDGDVVLMTDPGKFEAKREPCEIRSIRHRLEDFWKQHGKELEQLMFRRVVIVDLPPDLREKALWFVAWKYQNSMSGSRPAPEEDAVGQTISFEPASIAAEIAAACDELKALLLKKNAAYGNSALDPVRLFSRADRIEQIKVRIDDKLSRIHARGFGGNDEDTLADLNGYLILLRVALKRRTKQESATEPTDPAQPKCFGLFDNANSVCSFCSHKDCRRTSANAGKNN